MLQEGYSGGIFSVALSVTWIWSGTAFEHKVCRVSCDADIWAVCSKKIKITVARQTKLVAKRAATLSLYENRLLI